LFDPKNPAEFFLLGFLFISNQPSLILQWTMTYYTSKYGAL